jgi:hypothetical protein
MRVLLAVPFLAEPACNLFLHIIISCYMTRSESIKKPKLPWKSRKYTEQDSSYAHCISSAIFRRVPACNMFLHIITSCYMTRSDSIKKTKLTRKCRKCMEQYSPYARFIGSTTFGRVCMQPVLAHHNFLLYGQVEINWKAENIQNKNHRMLIVLAMPLFGGCLHATCSCTS